MPNPSVPRVFAILPAMLPSAVIYILRPMQALAQRGKVHFDFALEANATVEQVRQSDFVLFSRNYDKKYDFLLQEAVGGNIPCVYDLDDNFWELPLNSRVGRYFRAPVRLNQVEKYLRQVSLVRTFNPVMQQKVQENFNHQVFPALAGIDISLAPSQPVARDEKIQITYVTGRGSQDPLYAMFAEDLKAILQQYPQAEAVFFGAIPPDFMDFANVRSTSPIYDYEKFLHTLTRSGYDIGLAPLSHSVSDLSKTNTKFRDYGLSRIAGIYSNVPVYTNCVQHEQTGLIVDEQPGAWFQAMERLILDVDLRSQIQEAAYRQVVAQYHQGLMEQQWLDVLERLRPTRIWAFGWGGERQEPKGVWWGEQQQECAGFIQLQGGWDGTKALPFCDNELDRFVCYYTLEKVQDLAAAMCEIYRVCKPGAHLLVMASYSSLLKNQADPTYRSPINEQTFRYWTNAKQVGVAWDEYSEQIAEWGLLSNAEIDFRPERISFLYSPAYRDLSVVEQRQSRRRFMDACQAILGQFVVVKGGVEGMEEAKKTVQLDLPEMVEQKFEARVASLEEQLQEANSQVDTLKAQVTELEATLNAQATEFAATLNAQATEFAATLRMHQENATLLSTYRQYAALAMLELTETRRRKIIRWVDRVFNHQDLSQSLGDAFQGMLDDARMFNLPLKGFRLQLSENLQDVPFLEYEPKHLSGMLQSVWVATVWDFPLEQGVVGVEVVVNGAIATRGMVPATALNGAQKVQIGFSPVQVVDTDRVAIRVFGQQLDKSVRLLEYRRYRLGGLGKLQRRAFLSYVLG